MPQLVLVIDDEQPIRDLVGSLLAEEGWPVRTYSSAQAALRDVTSGMIRPSIVLLDMRMPGMDGPHFARALREQAPDTPIIVMTAARDAREWAEAIDAAGYIPKPFDIDWVIDTVARIAGTPDTDSRDASEDRDGGSPFSLLPIPALVQRRIQTWARGTTSPLGRCAPRFRARPAVAATAAR